MKLDIVLYVEGVVGTQHIEVLSSWNLHSVWGEIDGKGICNEDKERKVFSFNWVNDGAIF